jgi:hydrogenase nickel incorporation protein HypB
MAVVDLRTAVLAKNDTLAEALRGDLAAAGTVAVNLLSSPGSGKTALLEVLLTRCVERGIPVAALTGDLATENDAKRLARSGAPVRQVTTDGLCHLEADLVRDHLAGWLPTGTRILFVENVGNLVCPASYDLGESLRVVLASVTEGEDKPEKYPTAYRWADLVVLTKVDLADAAMTEAQAALLESLEPDRVVKQVQRTAVRVGKELAQRAPSMEAAALKWLDLFNKGKIVVEVDTSQLSDAVSKVGGLGKQATTGLIVVGQLIGTALAMIILLQPALSQFIGLAYLAMIAFGVTLVVSFVVLFRLLFSKDDG